MGLFSGIGNFLGLSGGARSGDRARRQLIDIGDELRNFTPLRVRSAAGVGTYSRDGLEFDMDPRIAAGAQSGFDFFGNTMNKLAAFNEGDATARTLALLRERRAPAFQSQLGALESRLLQQGRLGLATGARGDNPEMASFFGAESMADLESQLLASEETRRERSGMLDSAGSGLQLALEASMPSQFMSGLFNAEALRSARDIAAAKIKAGGPALEAEGAAADRAARAKAISEGMRAFFGGGLGG